MKETLGSVLLGVLWLFLISQSSFAQTQIPTETPTITPNPTVVSLDATVVAQQRQIEDLGNKLKEETSNREFTDRDLLWRWGIAATVATLVLGFLSWIGYGGIKDVKKVMEETRDEWKKNVRDLEKEWVRRSELILDKAIFRFDPSNLPIQLPTDLTKIHQALTHRALGKIEFYDDLDELDGEKLNGVIVVSMLDKEKLAEQQKKFRDFVSRHKLDPSMTGIILYTGSNRIDDDIFIAFENLVTANYLATVVSNILVVGRGIKIELPPK